VRVNTVPAPSVFERLENCQPGNGKFNSGFGVSRHERRSSLGLKAGEVFNPFQLFDGAIDPSEILRSSDLLPSEKLVFARLLQFARGRKSLALHPTTCRRSSALGAANQAVH
jgi:hypothetical protein